MAKAKHQYGKQKLAQTAAGYFLQELRNDEENRKRRFRKEIESTVQPVSKKPRSLDNFDTSRGDSKTNDVGSGRKMSSSNENMRSPVIPMENKAEIKEQSNHPALDEYQLPPAEDNNSMYDILRLLENNSETPQEVPYRRDGYNSGFQSLTDDVVTILLELVLKRGRPIKPMFKMGMMMWGIHSWSDEEHVVQYENIDLSILRVNKHLHQLGSELFYGSHKFVFHYPERCKWWIKRIGKNFPLVRELCLTIRTGWEPRRNGIWQDPNPCVFTDMCFEEQWYNIFSAQVQPHHNLAILHVTFLGWKCWPDCSRWNRSATLPAWVPTRAEDRETLGDWRNSIFNFLKAHMRGIRQVAVRELSGDWFRGGQELASLALLMQQSRSSMVQRRKKKKLTLTAALEHTRLRRQNIAC